MGTKELRKPRRGDQNPIFVSTEGCYDTHEYEETRMVIKPLVATTSKNMCRRPWSLSSRTQNVAKNSKEEMQESARKYEPVKKTPIPWNRAKEERGRRSTNHSTEVRKT